jgi:hypothetical protein
MDDEVEVQEPCTEVPESWTITIGESSDIEASGESQVQPEMTHQEAVPDSDEEGETVVQISEQASGETLSEQRNRFAAQEALDIGVGWSTFRVPPHVREVEKGAYTPKIVSIGPSYHNKPSLRPFEVEKERFFSRLQHQMRRRGWEVDLEEAMKEMEEKTRKCYSEDFGGTESDDFVRMMRRDGCFIVELLRLYSMRTSQRY